ncbi:MAG TPA: Na+ dependent nucleoside transporter N-terminal domain-containing protein, partial [Caulobacter sp.]|nr:Na+ dependent nucleoside transporter N-terminal domain-containing protein [Caulobacter sp.]
MFRPENVQALAGLALTLGLCWLVSENRKRFPWKLAIGAVIVQVGLVLLLFGLPQAQALLRGVNGAVEGLSASTQAGTMFIFGFLAGGEQPYPVSNAGLGFIFAFRVLPVILVVCALSALLWHWKIL